jgi:hypothetical protein
MLGDLSRFLSEVRNLPFSNFKFNIESCDNYGNRHVIQFMERYAPIVRRLTVSSFWKCASDGEWDFYESLQVLKQLVIDKIVLSPSGTTSRIPSCIQKLKVLDISSSEEFGAGNVIPYGFQLFEAAKELETFTPCSVGYLYSLKDEHRNDESSLEKYVRRFFESWERRAAGLGREGDKTLKVINLGNVRSDDFDEWFPPLWLELIRKILDQPANIMMHDMSSEALEFVEKESQILRRVVSSFGPFELFPLNAEMPNLEIWTIHNDVHVPHFSHPEWPRLREIYTSGIGLDLVK